MISIDSISIIVLLLMMGWYLEKFLKEKNWSNPFLNTFYIFNMIFSSPFNVILGIFTSSFLGIILALYHFDISNLSNTNINLDAPKAVFVITNSITTTALFIILTISSGLIAYYIWADNKGKVIRSYQNLLEFSKIFTFRIPLLVVTLGLCLPSLILGEITSLSYWIMIHGLYIVPLFLFVKIKMEKNKLGKNNGR